jgi:hypothetical protein
MIKSSQRATLNFTIQDYLKHLIMRLLVNSVIFATLLGVGSAVSNPTTRSSGRPQISTLEDIPKLPVGFTWDIKNRPKGDDKRTKTSSTTLNSRSNGFQKRAVTIDCSGVSAK